MCLGFSFPPKRYVILVKVQVAVPQSGMKQVARRSHRRLQSDPSMMIGGSKAEKVP